VGMQRQQSLKFFSKIQNEIFSKLEQIFVLQKKLRLFFYGSIHELYFSIAVAVLRFH
jgi:hypothetical protein